MVRIQYSKIVLQCPSLVFRIELPSWDLLPLTNVATMAQESEAPKESDAQVWARGDIIALVSLLVGIPSAIVATAMLKQAVINRGSACEGSEYRRILASCSINLVSF